MGIRCHSERDAGAKRAADMVKYADAIVEVWEPYIHTSLSGGFDEDDLRPITRVMYASALIPGGEYLSSCFLIDTIHIFSFSLFMRMAWAHHSILAFRSGYLGPEPKTIP